MKNDDGPITIDIKKAQSVLDLWVCDLTPVEKADWLKILIYCPEVGEAFDLFFDGKVSISTVTIELDKALFIARRDLDKLYKRFLDMPTDNIDN